MSIHFQIKQIHFQILNKSLEKRNIPKMCKHLGNFLNNPMPTLQNIGIGIIQFIGELKVILPLVYFTILSDARFRLYIYTLFTTLKIDFGFFPGPFIEYIFHSLVNWSILDDSILMTID